jgi:hypothetical protein
LRRQPLFVIGARMQHNGYRLIRLSWLGAGRVDQAEQGIRRHDETIASNKDAVSVAYLRRSIIGMVGYNEAY